MIEKTVEKQTYKDMHLKKFLKMIYKQILQELKEKPNNRIKVNITLDFGGDTNADVTIFTYENELILDEEKIK